MARMELPRRPLLKAAVGGILAQPLGLVGSAKGSLSDWWDWLFGASGAPLIIIVQTFDCNGDPTEARFAGCGWLRAEFIGEGPQVYFQARPTEYREGVYGFKLEFGDDPSDAIGKTGYFEVSGCLRCPEADWGWQVRREPRARLIEFENLQEVFDRLTGLSNFSDPLTFAKWVIESLYGVNAGGNLASVNYINYIGYAELHCDCSENEEEPSTTVEDEEEHSTTAGGVDDSNEDGEGDDSASTAGDGPTEEQIDTLETLTTELRGWLNQCEEIRQEIADAQEVLKNILKEQESVVDDIEETERQLHELKQDSRVWVYQNSRTGEIVFHAGQKFDPNPPLALKGWIIPQDVIADIQSLEADLQALEERLDDLHQREQEQRERIEGLRDRLDECEQECANLESRTDAAAKAVWDAQQEAENERAARALGEYDELSSRAESAAPAFLPPVQPAVAYLDWLDNGIPISPGLNLDFIGLKGSREGRTLTREREGGYLFISPNTDEVFPLPLDISTIVEEIDPPKRSRGALFRRERVNLYYTYGPDLVGLIGLDIRNDVPVDTIVGGYRSPTLDAHTDAGTLYTMIYSDNVEKAIRQAWDDNRLRVRGQNPVVTVKTGVPAFFRDVVAFVTGIGESIGRLLG